MQAPAGPAQRWALLAAGWLMGTALQLQQSALWAPALVGLAAALALPLLVWAWRARWPTTGQASDLSRLPRAPLRLLTRLMPLLLLLAAAVLGFAATQGRAALRLADALPDALQGQDLQLTGVVRSLPRITLLGTRFVFEVESAQHQGRPVAVPPQVWLGWYQGIDEDALLSGPAEDLRAGQRWMLPVRLQQPHGLLNPHGFDHELWLFEQGLRASGHVRSRAGERARLLDDRAGSPVQRLRQDLRDAIALRVADLAAAGVLAALAVGDQAAIERADWDVFRATGVAHLMAISGLHVTMFAWLAAALLQRLWRLHPAWPLAVPAPMAARWGGLLAAVGYALLAGWGVPAQRTVWMLAAVALLRSAGRRWPLPALLPAAALVVAVVDPRALLQPGFWLSFVAVGLLAAAEPVQPAEAQAPGRLARLLAALRAGLRTQLVATVGLAPLTLIFFQQLSVVGLAANLLAIPLVTLLITPLALLGVLLPPLWLAAAALVQGLMVLLQALAAWPAATWTAAVAPAWAAAAGLLGGLLAVLPLPWRHRAMALALLLPLLWPPLARPAHGQFELLAADIGQGTAVLLRTASHLLVYDAGPMYSRDTDAGQRVLLPLLRARGERQVDLLMLSHRDIDHVGGAAALMAGLPVAALSGSLEPGHPLLAQGPPHTPCLAGQQWEWDGVRLQVLHPTAAELARPGKPNARSCVLHVQGATRSALLTGDIEAAQEAALVARSGEALRAQVLLAPHHGSATSSSPALLQAVQPQLALVQAGHRNRYGHPARDVMARYQAAGIVVQRSSSCGAFTLPAVGEGWCERRVSRRYWHHPGPAAAP